MNQISDEQVISMLKSTNNEATKSYAQDTALVKALAKVLNATLKMASDPTPLAIANKTAAISGLAEKTTGSNSLKAANFVTIQGLKTIGLIKIAGMSPAKASTYVTLVVADKIVAAAGLAQFKKCHVALASLTVTSGMGAFACAGTFGVGCLAGAVAIAADAFDAYGQCHQTKH
ncbi:MAG: hypothetical protein AB1586_02865 [Pseudomonadota bacterium]